MTDLRALFALDGDLEFRVPDFAALADDDYRAAIEAGMAEQAACLAALAADDAPPTAQLLADFERSGTLLRRAWFAFGTLRSADATAARDAIAEALSAKLAAHDDAIWLDGRLRDRFAALAKRAADGEIALDEQDAWLLAEVLRRFRRAGVELDDARQGRLREVNQRLAVLASQFEQLVIAGRKAGALVVEDAAALDGLSEDQLQACRAAAEAAGQSGYRLELVNTTGQPALAVLTNRETRRRLYEASIGRGSRGQTDVRPLLLETLRLRAEKAKLLGFDNFAAYAADDGVVKTTAAIDALLVPIAEAARRNAEREAAELQALLDADLPGESLQPWDWQFYAERAQAADAFDEAELRPYLPFESVLENGVFAAANQLYSLTFARREDVTGYTDDCRAYEVRDEDGAKLGLVLFDPYARPTKGGGAWMTQLAEPSDLLATRAVVTNNCNQVKPVAGRPSLMAWDEVVTLFHEFGHDIHGLLGRVRYPSVAGTATPRDFVEYPSQFNEQLAWRPELIQRYARHWRTGQPMPSDLVAKLAASRHCGEGYAACELYQAMLLDQLWHRAPVDALPDADGVDAWERAALEDAGVAFELVPPRYKTCYFTHIWSHDYAAAYYSYLVSEVMDADTAAWLEASGGPTRANGRAFAEAVLARGYSVDIMAAYRALLGHDPDPAALLRRRGLE
ncbi:MAG: M3 family metallopeptidase [Propionibacteriaceae bacterium]|jgi:peptidyl-dipeptidase Dcp|nr:M3 family metallopeptidase [Propionibacteriaceae bacterium]